MAGTGWHLFIFGLIIPFLDSLDIIYFTFFIAKQILTYTKTKSSWITLYGQGLHYEKISKDLPKIATLKKRHILNRTLPRLATMLFRYYVILSKRAILISTPSKA